MDKQQDLDVDFDFEILGDDSKSETIIFKRQLAPTDTINKTRGFALAKFEKNMTLLQRRMFASALSQIKPGDSINAAYEIDAHAIAKALKIAKSSITENCEAAAATLIDKNQVVYFETDKGNWVRSVLIDNIERKGKNVFVIQFGRKLMPYLVAMKENYDLSYPLGGPLSFKSKYSHLFYDFFLAQMSMGIFEITVTPTQVREEILQIKGDEYRHVGHLRDRAIMPAVREIDKLTEINVPDPFIQYQGKTLVNYTFKISFKSNLPLPIKQPNMSQMSLFNNVDVPTDEQLDKEMAAMGVAPSFRKSVINKKQPIKIWRNILYTKLYGGGEAKYFNKAFREDFAKNHNIDEMQRRLQSIKQIDLSADSEWQEMIQKFQERKDAFETNA